jgi:hypothetical protein
MFQSSAKRLRAWLSLADDLLGDPPAAAQPHPHRRELRWQRSRRPGAVSPRPSYCLCPVRGGSGPSKRERAVR